MVIANILASGRKALLTLAVCSMAGLGAACTTTTPTSGPMMLAGPVTPPAGALHLCQEQPEVCGSSSGIAVAASEEQPQVATGGRASSDPSHAKSLSDSSQVASPPPPPVIDLATPASTASSNTRRISSDADTMALLESVNRQVNRALRWRSDQEIYGEAERWAMPLSDGAGTIDGQIYGDCEDYALEKRAALIRAGLPPEALAIAIVDSYATGHHAVLIVRLDGADVVLDNETPWILPWTEAPYTWRAVQSGPSLLEWRSLALMP